MKKDIKELWMFSQHLDETGGTRTVVNEAKKILTRAGFALHHAWVTSFSPKFNKGDKQELYFKALPLPVYLNNLLAGLKWRRKLRNLRTALVLGGGPVSAAIPFVANIPYVMWIGTSLFDEYKTRSLKEDFLNRNHSLFLNKLFLSLNKIIEYYVLKKAQFIVVQSSYMIKSLSRDYNIDERKMEYLPYPVTVKGQSKKKSFNKTGPVLLAVGRVDDNRKNFFSLLEAVRFAIKKLPRTRLRIAGDVISNSNLLKVCHKLGLSPFVNFLGKISGEELSREYENADIFVLTPRQEGLGIVYLEAMSYGLPIVTTKCGGPEGIVINGVNGYLVDQDNPKAFSDAIEMVWSSKDRYRELSSQAKNYILENHNSKKFNRRFIEILQTYLDIDMISK